MEPNRSATPVLAECRQKPVPEVTASSVNPSRFTVDRRGFIRHATQETMQRLRQVGVLWRRSTMPRLKAQWTRRLWDHDSTNPRTATLRLTADDPAQPTVLLQPGQRRGQTLQVRLRLPGDDALMHPIWLRLFEAVRSSSTCVGRCRAA